MFIPEWADKALSKSSKFEMDEINEARAVLVLQDQKIEKPLEVKQETQEKQRVKRGKYGRRK